MAYLDAQFFNLIFDKQNGFVQKLFLYLKRPGVKNLDRIRFVSIKTPEKTWLLDKKVVFPVLRSRIQLYRYWQDDPTDEDLIKNLQQGIKLGDTHIFALFNVNGPKILTDQEHQQLEELEKTTLAEKEREEKVKKLATQMEQQKKKVELEQQSNIKLPSPEVNVAPATTEAPVQAQVTPPTEVSPQLVGPPIPAKTTAIPSSESISQPQLPDQIKNRIKPELPEFAKDVANKAEIFAYKQSRKYLVPDKFFNIISAVAGAALGATTGNPLMVAAGATAGLAVPQIINQINNQGVYQPSTPAPVSSAGQALRKANSFIRSNPISKGKMFVPLMGLLFGAMFLMIFSGGAGSLEASPNQPSISVSSDFKSCLFTRSDQNPKEAAFDSPLLLGYFMEASALTGVPPELIAAVARVESPGSTKLTDDQILNYTCTASNTSETGAMGLMQIQPPGSIGSPSGGLLLAAQRLGKEVDQINLCNIKENIVVGAEVIITKAGGNTWNPDWINSQEKISQIASGYYGCLRYGPGECTSGPYNYGNDLWSSIQSCRQSISQPQNSNPLNCPVPNGVIKEPSYQASSTSGHCSPSYGSCPANSRLAKSIDVDTRGGDVVFPNVNGQSVEWKYENQFPLNPSDCESGTVNCGRAYVFSAQVGADIYVLHLLHIDPTNLKTQANKFGGTSGSYKSGSIVGPTVPNVFVHINFGKNVAGYKNPPPGRTDFDNGWLAPDFMCKGAINENP